MAENTDNDGLAELLYRWEARSTAAEAQEAAYYIRTARRAIELSNNSLAFDILKEGLAEHGNQPELVYWSALASARGGSTQTALDQINLLLPSLDQAHALFSDVLSLAGRIEKDVFAKSQGTAQRHEAATKSANYYQEAFAADNDYFPGINAATMTVLSGQLEAGHEIAGRVKSLCTQVLEGTGEPAHWLLASLGEACLLLGEERESARWYEKAVVAAESRYGDIATMRRQVKLLAGTLEGVSEVLDVLPIPGVVVFSGHMIDEPGRPEVRFPESITTLVRDQLDRRLDQLNAGFGYCSAACGADLLFVEAMLARGAEVHIVLPFSRDDFLKTSINFAGTGWIKRFNHAIENASSVIYATEEAYLEDTVLFSFAASVLAGMARLRSEQLETKATMLTVLDPVGDKLEGGARDTLDTWSKTGLPALNIDLAALRDNAVSYSKCLPTSTNPANKHISSVPPAMSRQIQTMMFADVVGFSKLCEASTAAFFIEFLSRVEQIIDACEVKPSFCNTWGDGLFVVFEDVTASAKFALTLRDMVAETDWVSLGLPVNLDIRVGMHTGPVFRAHDPIIGKDNFFGTQVNRAARIEPVAVPGSVMLTEQCACLLAESGVNEYACDYLGVIELAKKFGSGNLYRLRRSSEIE